MRAVITGTDFLKDIDGSFKVIETNTNIQTQVPTNLYFDTTKLDDLISGSSINEIVYITKTKLDGNSEDIDLTENTDESVKIKNFKNTLKTYCESKSYIFTLLNLDENAITVPYVEDTENKLIIRISYDTTAVIDDTYAKDNWEFLKLMYDTDVNLIPKCYINDSELGIDNIGNTLRDNGNHPNYLIKKRHTPADNRIFPKILKISTIEELETIKQSLEVDEYIQEYIYNPNDLMDNRIKHYRSVDLLYGSSLEVLNLWCVESTNAFEIDGTCDYNDNNQIQYWERPKYVHKFINARDKDPHLSGDENTMVILEDNTKVKLSSLETNSVIKTISIPNLPINELDYITGDWSSSYTDFINNYQPDTATLVSKKVQENWVGFFYEIETTDGIIFSDVSQAVVLCKTLQSGSTDNYVVKFKSYSNLEPTDTLLLVDTETSTIVDKNISSVSISYGMVNVYTTNFEQIDIFLTMEESENSKWGIMTHNYTYDCNYAYCYPRCNSCGSGWWEGHGVSGCCRCGGVYGNCSGYGQSANFANGCASCDATYYQAVCFNGYNCNGQKSDKRLKKKIKYIETTKEGLKLYTFEFKKSYINRVKSENNVDLNGTYKGVLAQDLINTKFEPHVIIELDGYYAVDYEGLGIKLERQIQQKIK
jgi:hypothetical protein